MTKRIVIIGGVAGGASCATRLRRLDEDAEIIILERGGYVSFANCGLPYHIGGSIEEIEDLLVETPESIKQKYNIDVRLFNEAQAIDRSNKKVSIMDHSKKKEYEEEYDFLVLSPGADPIIATVPGVDQASNVFTISTIPDVERMRQLIVESGLQTAVIVGAGYIGIEMAENLKETGLVVYLVELMDQILPPLDVEMAAMVESYLSEMGVEVLLQERIIEVLNSGQQVLLDSGKKLKSDLIVFATGVAPVAKLAIESGLLTGIKNTIKTDVYLRTSDPNIYALGDAVEVEDYVSKVPAHIPLAGPANRQGRIVANNICGKGERYAGTIGTSVVKVFDLTVATTGNNEKILKRLGLPYQAIHIHANSHAKYYPESKPLSLKMLFNPYDGTIYGAQAIGEKGAEKRIDILATAIKGRLTVYDLKEMELSYAPPYSSAKDPVNMLGFIAANIKEGIVKTVQWHDIDNLCGNSGFLLDVRTEDEWDEGYINGAVNIPLGEIRKRMHEVPKVKEVFVYCKTGLRSYLATRILMQKGYSVTNLDGGYNTYSIAKR